MRRREFIGVLGAAATWSIAAHAQGERARLVGWLLTLSEDHPEGQARIKAFREGLAASGWTEGRNLHIEYRWGATDPARRRDYAAELVQRKPDAVVAGGSASLVALLQASSTVPIVFVATAGNIEQGFITNAARPSGNATGFTLFGDFSLAGKMLGILKEMSPPIARVALMMQRGHPSLTAYAGALERDTHQLGTDAILAPVGSAAEIESTIETVAREPNGSLLLPPDQFLLQHRGLIIAAAARHSLPAAYGYRRFVEGGGLISYGVDTYDLYRRAAGYVDRILKGEKPAELPVQAPTRYELLINLKTAKALGLTIPPTLLARADEVIE
jgi:putative ABC transport system substrate-binding protein